MKADQADNTGHAKRIGEEDMEANVHPDVPEGHDNITGTIPIYLDWEDKSKAESKLLIRAIQAHYFEKEISNLFKMGILDPNSVNELRTKASGLLTLSPFLDEEVILRVGGRSGLYDYKHPIIMPGAEKEVNQSLIRHYHLQNFHCTSVETHYLIKQRFYLMGGKNSVEKVVSKCVDCQNAELRLSQKTGDLFKKKVTTAEMRAMCDNWVGRIRLFESADRGGVSDQAGQADTAARNICSGRAGHTDNLVSTGQDQVSAPKHIGEEEVDTNVHPKVSVIPDTETIPIFRKVEKSKAEVAPEMGAYGIIL